MVFPGKADMVGVTVHPGPDIVPVLPLDSLGLPHRFRVESLYFSSTVPGEEVGGD